MIEYQRLILGDMVRNDAFKAALQKVVKPGESVVADVGSGTGYLGFLASKLGAKHCHLYEMHPGYVKLSKALAKRSGIANCTFHAGHSTAAKGGTKVDVLVSETLGNYALEENILETLQDARRFLKPGGVMIPSRITQYAAPVTAPRLQKELEVWDLGGGLDFTPAREACLHNIYVRTVRADDLSRDMVPKVWDEIDLTQDQESIRTATVEWKAAKTQTVHGFALWWECTLVPGVELSTAPDARKTHWEQIYMPLLKALDVDAGETVKLGIRSDTRYAVKVHIAWEAKVFGADGKERQAVRMDMKKGMI